MSTFCSKNNVFKSSPQTCVLKTVLRFLKKKNPLHHILKTVVLTQVLFISLLSYSMLVRHLTRSNLCKTLLHWNVRELFATYIRNVAAKWP